MSTKIYNGFRLKNMTLSKLQDWSMEFREKVATANKELTSIHQASICACLIDYAFLYDSRNFLKLFKEYSLKLDNYPLMAAMDIMYQRRKKIEQTNQRDPEFDYSCSLMLFPVKSQVLGIPYTEKSEHIQILESMLGYEEYGYWNNTDRPDKVSFREWGKRRRDWKQALPIKIGIPNLCGFKIICDDSDWNFLDEVIPYLPDSIHRSKTLANNIVSYEFNGTNLWDYLTWRKSNEFKQKVADKEQELTEILRPRITRDDLLMPFKQIYEFTNNSF